MLYKSITTIKKTHLSLVKGMISKIYKPKESGAFLLLMSLAVSAHASQTAQYPWAETLQKIATSLDGPVAWSISIIAVVAAGLGMAFGDLQGGAKKIMQAFLGISIAFGVTTILSTLFTFSSSVI